MSCSSCTYVVASNPPEYTSPECDPTSSSYNKCNICNNTQNVYQCLPTIPTIANDFSCFDGSGNITKTNPIPCGTCPLKINSIPRSPYRAMETPASVYTENLSSLYVYQRPLSIYHNVNWNQSSDRAIPHIQPTSVLRNSSSLRATRTGSRPGAMVPGGKGVDIKHNSFNRYNLRLRGAVLKTKPTPGTFLKFPSYKFKSSACYKCE